MLGIAAPLSPRVEEEQHQHQHQPRETEFPAQWTSEAMVHSSLAANYMKKANYDRALTSYEQALFIYRRDASSSQVDLCNVAATYHNMGMLHKQCRRYHQAVACLEEAEALYRQCFDTAQKPETADTANGVCLEFLLAETLQHRGNLHQSHGDISASIDCHEEIVGMLLHPLSKDEKAPAATVTSPRTNQVQFVRLQDDQKLPLLSASLKSLGSLYFQQGHTEEALGAYEEALDLLRSGGASPREDSMICSILLAISCVYFALQRLDLALETLKQCGYSEPVLVALSNLGQTFEAQHDLGKALECYRALLEIRKDALGKTHPDIAQTHVLLAKVNEENGTKDEAVMHYQEALELYKLHASADPKFGTRVAELLREISKFSADTGSKDNAVTVYQSALTSQAGVSALSEACVFLTLAKSFQQKGSFQAAMDSLEEVRQQLRSLSNDGNDETVAEILEEVAELERALLPKCEQKPEQTELKEVECVLVKGVTADNANTRPDNDDNDGNDERKSEKSRTASSESLVMIESSESSNCAVFSKETESSDDVLQQNDDLLSSLRDGLRFQAHAVEEEEIVFETQEYPDPEPEVTLVLSDSFTDDAQTQEEYPDPELPDPELIPDLPLDLLPDPPLDCLPFGSTDSDEVNLVPRISKTAESERRNDVVTIKADAFGFEVMEKAHYQEDKETTSSVEIDAVPGSRAQHGGPSDDDSRNTTVEAQDEKGGSEGDKPDQPSAGSGRVGSPGLSSCKSPTPRPGETSSSICSPDPPAPHSDTEGLPFMVITRAGIPAHEDALIAHYGNNDYNLLKTPKIVNKDTGGPTYTAMAMVTSHSTEQARRSRDDYLRSQESHDSGVETDHQAGEESLVSGMHSSTGYESESLLGARLLDRMPPHQPTQDFPSITYVSSVDDDSFVVTDGESKVEPSSFKQPPSETPTEVESESSLDEGATNQKATEGHYTSKQSLSNESEEISNPTDEQNRDNETDKVTHSGRKTNFEPQNPAGGEAEATNFRAGHSHVQSASARELKVEINVMDYKDDDDDNQDDETDEEETHGGTNHGDSCDISVKQETRPIRMTLVRHDSPVMEDESAPTKCESPVSSRSPSWRRARSESPRQGYRKSPGHRFVKAISRSFRRKLSSTSTERAQERSEELVDKEPLDPARPVSIIKARSDSFDSVSQITLPKDIFAEVKTPRRKGKTDAWWGLTTEEIDQWFPASYIANTLATGVEDFLSARSIHNSRSQTSDSGDPDSSSDEDSDPFDDVSHSKAKRKRRAKLHKKQGDNRRGASPASRGQSTTQSSYVTPSEHQSEGFMRDINSTKWQPPKSLVGGPSIQKKYGSPRTKVRLSAVQGRLEEQIRDLGKDHPDLAPTLITFALIYSESNNSEAAIKLLLWALKIQKKAREPEEVVRSLHILADIYCREERYSLALSCFDDIQLIEDHLYGQEHPNVAITLNQIGQVHAFQGEFSLAMEHHQLALQVLKCCFGEDLGHPAVAQTLIYIGDIYYRERNSILTIRAQSDGYKLFIETGMLEIISRAHEDRGNYKLALNFLEERLELVKSGKVDMPKAKLAEIMFNLGTLCCKSGRYLEAVDYYEEAIKIQDKLGYTDVQKAMAKVLIGTVHAGMGQYGKAWSLLDAALKVFITNLDADDAMVADTMQRMGKLEIITWNHRKAKEHLEKALEMQKSLFSATDLGALQSKVELARLAMLDARADAAIKEFYAAQESQHAILGPSHPEIADTLLYLGEAYALKGQSDKAMSCFEESFSMREQFLGRDHPMQAETIYQMAQIHILREKFPKALQLSNSVLKIRKENLGERHSDVAVALCSISKCHLSMGKLKEASPCLTEALKIAQDAFGENHPLVGDIHVQRGILCLKRCNFKASKAAFDKASKVYRMSRLSPKHPCFVEVTALLQRVDRDKKMCV